MNYKLTISYNGSKYHGWAQQPNQRTIEGELLDAIAKLFNENTKINASGRTDTGVHAINQVINFNLNNNVSPIELQKALNSKLDHDIRVINAEQASNNFHARFFAKTKTYMYIIDCHEVFNPIFESNFYQYNKPIDLEKIIKVSQNFIGTKNFLSFSTSEFPIDRCVRTIYNIDCQYKDDFLIIKICGNGFLRSMVRMIVGCILSYNDNKISEERIVELFNNPQKGGSGFKVPGCGLYLVGVEYEN